MTGLSLTACSEDDLDTNQYKGGVSLNAFGPNPVMRGGVVRFVGSNLDQIAQVQVPGIQAITNIEVVKSGIPSEIKITLPKDGPAPGIITLVSKTDQKLQTFSPIEYIEPIVCDKIDPEYIMPGQVLTITGDYLNLVHSITFGGDVTVSELDFVPEHHSRYEIQVVVPETAVTGRIGLNDLDLTQISDDEISYNTIESENPLQIGNPSIAKIASPRGEAELQGSVTAKKGEKITITGDFLNLVASIMTGDADSEFGTYEFNEFEASADGKSITFNLPEGAPDGDINLICKNGVAVPVGKLVTVKPSECVATPNPVKNGAELTISGKDMDVTMVVAFPIDGGTHELAEPTSVSETAVKVIVPEAAVDGKIQMVMANGMYTEVDYALVMPTVESYSSNPVSAGGALNINGANLDLVQTVTFNGSETPVTGDDLNVTSSLISLTVPMDAQSGKITFTLKNKMKVEVAEIQVKEAVFCYATELPGADDEIKAGSTFTLPVKNIDKLTGVEINGEGCQYITSGDNLIIGVPEKAKKGSSVRLISSNGEITYTIDFIPNTDQKIVLWQGMTEITWGDGGRVFLPANAFDDIPEGAELVLCYTQKDGVWAQAQINDGWWGKMPGLTDPNGIVLTNGDGCLVPTDIYGWFSDGQLNRETSILLTADVLAHLKSHVGANGSLVIQGQDLIFTKIYIHYTISLETKVWEGIFDEGNWTNWEVGKGTHGDDNPNMFLDNGLKAGSTIYVYVKPKDAWWQLQFFDGHWGGLTEVGAATGANNGNNLNPNVYTLDDKGRIAIPVTPAIAEKLSLTDWGIAWILQCENLVITKITIE